MSNRNNLNRHMKARVRNRARRHMRLVARLGAIVLLLLAAIAPASLALAQDAGPAGAPVDAKSLCLVPAPGDNNGSISGTVTAAAGGAPIQGVIVRAHDLYGRIQLQATTSVTGTYTINSVYPGDWVVRFATNGSSMTTPYIARVYDGVASLNDTTVLQVAVGEDVTGIDSALAVGAPISGTVVDLDTGLPIQFASVFVSQASDPDGIVESALTNASGVFRLRAGLAPGDYLVHFFAGGYESEWYDDAPDAESAATITIVGTQPHEINAALTPIPEKPEGKITGRITEAATGDPVADALVTPLGQGFYSLDRYEYTDAQGYYTLTVPAGAYKLRANDVSVGTTLAARYLGPSIAYTSAITFAVEANQTATNRNIALEEGFFIEGTVLGPGGAPADLIQVTAYEGAGALESGFTYSRQSDPDGTYRIGPLPKLPFNVYFSPPSRLCDLVEKKIVVLPEAMGAATVVETELARGMLISGRVTNAATDLGLRSTFVQAFDTNGIRVGADSSAETGYYLLNALPTGTYRIGFEAENFVDQYYDSKPSLATASVVAGTAGLGYLGIDAAMATDPTGGGLENPVYIPLVSDE